jgi:hypothetical protein
LFFGLCLLTIYIWLDQNNAKILTKVENKASIFILCLSTLCFFYINGCHKAKVHIFQAYYALSGMILSGLMHRIFFKNKNIILNYWSKIIKSISVIIFSLIIIKIFNTFFINAPIWVIQLKWLLIGMEFPLFSLYLQSCKMNSQ